MTPTEFKVLQELSARGLSDGSALEKAARDVLVRGHTVERAGAKHGHRPARVKAKIDRLLDVRKTVLRAYEPKESDDQVAPGPAIVIDVTGRGGALL